MPSWVFLAHQKIEAGNEQVIILVIGTQVEASPGLLKGKVIVTQLLSLFKPLIFYRIKKPIQSKHY